MKIIIVGGGIGGLAAYHALRKHLADASPPVSIVVFESHESIVSTSSVAKMYANAASTFLVSSGDPPFRSFSTGIINLNFWKTMQ